jgi:hypothetical protein
VDASKVFIAIHADPYWLVDIVNFCLANDRDYWLNSASITVELPTALLALAHFLSEETVSPLEVEMLEFFNELE